MNLKHARGMWVDKQIYELQSQMAMVQRFLVKLGKVPSMDGRFPYYHSMLPPDQMMSNPCTNESEHFVEVELIPCPHEEGVEGHSNLFHDEYEPSQISDLFDPSSPPIFDSFELEHEDVNSGIEQDSSDQNVHELDLFSPITPQIEHLETSAAIGSCFHAQPRPKEYSVASRSDISFTKGQEQSRVNNFKNCYMFKREGLHSVQALMKEEYFKPGVHLALVFVEVASSQSENTAPYVAQTFPAHCR